MWEEDRDGERGKKKGRKRKKERGMEGRREEERERDRYKEREYESMCVSTMASECETRGQLSGVPTKYHLLSYGLQRYNSGLHV